LQNFRIRISERILNILVKANHLWMLSKSCSAVLKLPVTKFSSRLVGYSWSY